MGNEHNINDPTRVKFQGQNMPSTHPDDFLFQGFRFDTNDENYRGELYFLSFKSPF